MTHTKLEHLELEGVHRRLQRSLHSLALLQEQLLVCRIQIAEELERVTLIQARLRASSLADDDDSGPADPSSPALTEVAPYPSVQAAATPASSPSPDAGPPAVRRALPGSGTVPAAILDAAAILGGVVTPTAVHRCIVDRELRAAPPQRNSVNTAMYRMLDDGFLARPPGGSGYVLPPAVLEDWQASGSAHSAAQTSLQGKVDVQEADPAQRPVTAPLSRAGRRVRPGTIAALIVKHAPSIDQPFSPSSLCDRFDEVLGDDAPDRIAVNKTLGRLVERGQLHKPGRGRYELIRAIAEDAAAEDNTLPRRKGRRVARRG